MPEGEKEAMMRFLDQCSRVIDGEMSNLQSWANQASDAGRSVRCQQRRVEIAQGARARMDALLATARATPAAQVLRSPDPADETLIEPNEEKLQDRRALDVNTLSNGDFQFHLGDAGTNCDDAVNDANFVFTYCTSAATPIAALSATMSSTADGPEKEAKGPAKKAARKAARAKPVKKKRKKKRTKKQKRKNRRVTQRTRPTPKRSSKPKKKRKRKE